MRKDGSLFWALSHELRDPLASIRNAIGIMQARTLDDPHLDWVTNLMNNPMKYTPEGGRIRVAVRLEAGRALISVRDTGIGIATHLLGQIFELFVQGERDGVQARGGLGVGLTLAKRLVQMHDGTIEAYSNGPVADSTAMLLAYWGYKAIGAYDGPSALAAAEFQPEIVLLDLDLPGMSSEELSRRLREDAGQRRMVTVAVTGHGQPKDLRRSREAGFEYHEVRPVDPARLKTLLATIVAENLRRPESAPPDRPSGLA